MSAIGPKRLIVPYRVRLVVFALIGGAVTMVAGGLASSFVFAVFFTAADGDDWVGLFAGGVVTPIALAAFTWYVLWRWVAKARPTFSED